MIEFGRTDTSRLVDRLKAICRLENLTVSGEALRSLAATTENDIRSCLNTLQFVRAEATRASSVHSGGNSEDDSTAPRFRVTTDMITRAAVGIKDQTRALYDVLGAVFRKPDMRMRATAQNEIPVSGGIADREGGFDPSAAALRYDAFASAASALRAAHFQDLMAQVFFLCLAFNLCSSRGSDVSTTRFFCVTVFIIYSSCSLHLILLSRGCSLLDSTRIF